MHLLNLPPEIINTILSHLSPSDLISCQLTSQYLNTTILNSVGIQYNRALTLASATNSPFSTRPTAEKLGSLKRIEDAWAKMRTDFVLNSEVPLRESGVYDLTAGVYLLSTADRTGLGYMHLPSKEGEKASWEMIRIGKFIVDVGLCVYEHDLMAVVTSAVRNTPAGKPNTFDIDIDLLELSTKKPHPLAHNSSIHVLNSLWDKPSVGIEIVGKHLVLILSFNAREHPEDRAFIFDWITGAMVASFEARCHTYGSILFLDEDHFLLPNTRTNALDIYRIPSAPTLARLEPILHLALPPLIDGRILGFLTCRAEPNPIGKDSYANMRARGRDPQSGSVSSHSGDTSDDVGGQETPVNLLPNRDFLLESSTALCMFELRIHVLMFHLVPGGGLQMGFPFRYSFTFVAPRLAFLDLIATHATQSKHADAPNVGAPSRTSADDRVPVREREDPTSITDFFSSTSHQPPAVTPLSNILTAINRFAAPPESKAPRPSEIPKIAYDDWGPMCTRWFGSNEYDVSIRWITTSAGGRCVRMPAPNGWANGHGEGNEGERFYVYDFNHQRVEAARARRKEEEKVNARVEEGRVTDGLDEERKGKERTDNESKGDNGDDGDEDEDGAPRREKGKGKARMEGWVAAAEDTQTGSERKTYRPSAPARGARRNRHTLFGIPGLMISDDEGPSNEADGDPGAFDVGDDHDEHEPHDVGDLDDVDAPQVHPEAPAQSQSDRTMDMFLEHVDAMDDFDEQGDLFDYDDDQDNIDDDHLSEDEDHDQGNQAEVFGYDHDHAQDVDAETHSTYSAGIFGLEHNEDLEDDLDPPDLEIHNAEQDEPISDREDWTFDFLPSSGTSLLDEASTLDCPEVFQNPIRHALPCIIQGSERPHRWNGVLLDEERVIGILADPATGHVKEIEIHHFG